MYRLVGMELLLEDLDYKNECTLASIASIASIASKFWYSWYSDYLEILDHLIVTSEGFYSFTDEGLL